MILLILATYAIFSLCTKSKFFSSHFLLYFSMLSSFLITFPFTFFFHLFVSHEKFLKIESNSMVIVSSELSPVFECFLDTKKHPSTKQNVY